MKLFRKLKSLVSRFDKKDLILLIPIAIFFIATYGIWGEVPSLDSMVIYRESSQFFHNGLDELARMGYTLHPILINAYLSLFFLVFGTNPLSYNIAGFCVYLFALLISYFTIKKEIGFRQASLFILFIFTNPLIIVNSIFLSNDMILLAVILGIITSMVYRKYLYLAIFLILSTISKETGLVFFLTYVGINIVYDLFNIKGYLERKKRISFKRYLVIIPSIISIISWRLILGHYNLTEWRDTLFTPGTESSFMLVVKNILTFSFVNDHLFKNLENLLIYYFHWVYTILLLISLFSFNIKKVIKNNNDDKKNIFTPLVIIFGISYIILAFSFPTWTVLRYILPVLPTIFLPISIYFGQFKKTSLILGILIIIFNTVNIFYSLDPLTKQEFKGDDISYGYKMYAIGFEYRGPDRIAYNRTYLEASKKQNDIIREVYIYDPEVLITNCIELKLGEKMWSISVHNEFYPGMIGESEIRCFNSWDFFNVPDLIKNKRIYIRSTEPDPILLELKNGDYGSYTIVRIDETDDQTH